MVYLKQNKTKFFGKVEFRELVSLIVPVVSQIEPQADRHIVTRR